MNELKKPKSFLFVCTGNTCRSPMAEYLFKSLQKTPLSISSAGTSAVNGEKMSLNTMKILLKKTKYTEQELMKHKARKIDLDFLKKYDLIIAMEDAHKNFINSFNSVPSLSVVLLSQFSNNSITNIRDPIIFSFSGYLSVMHQIESCLLGLKKALDRC